MESKLTFLSLLLFLFTYKALFTFSSKSSHLLTPADVVITLT